MQWNQLSEKLLLQVKREEQTQELEQQLAEQGNLDSLLDSLLHDDQKKACWINLYNAFFLILRKREQMGRPAIFKEKTIKIAGHYFSLDDIEHGILRKYRVKWALGFLPNLFPPSTIRKLAVSKPDYRIHFALNCGAESCPPIAFYNAYRLQSQLEMATLSFLEAETVVKAEKNEIWVSRLMLWYMGDFGGKRGIKKMLREKLGLDTKGKKIRFRTYSWEEHLDNWQQNEEKQE